MAPVSVQPTTTAASLYWSTNTTSASAWWIDEALFAPQWWPQQYVSAYVAEPVLSPRAIARLALLQVEDLRVAEPLEPNPHLVARQRTWTGRHGRSHSGRRALRGHAR